LLMSSNPQTYPTGYPNPGTLDPPGRPANVKVRGSGDFDKEFVTSNGWNWGGVQVLGWQIDDVEREVGPRTYARMSKDPKIHKARRIIIHGTLTDDLVFATGATEEEAGSPAEYKKYEFVMQFCERIVAGLESPYWRTLAQMEGGKLEQGHKIAEIIYEDRVDGPTKSLSTETRPRGTKPRQARSILGRVFGMKAAEPEAQRPARGTGITKRPQVRLMPRYIKVKPRGSVLFVTDQFMNVLGLIPAWNQGVTSFYAHEVISRDKFLVLTHNQEDEDPRGNSAWRPAYNWYNFKTRIPKQYLRYLMQEAMPIPVGKLPPNTEGWLFSRAPNGEILYDELTGKPKFLEATTSMALTIQGMYEGKGVVIPHEAELAPYQGKGATGHKVYPDALQTADDQIEDSILLQKLGQSEGEHQARSAAQVHSDVKGDMFFWEKREMAVMTLYDLCAPCVRENLGEWAMSYMPKLSLGESEKRDWARDLEVVSKAYFYGFIDDSMRAELCAWLNLPRPGPSRFELLGEAQDDGAQIDSKGEPVSPSKTRPDKQPGNKGRNDGNSTEKEARLEAIMAQLQEKIARIEAGTNERGMNNVESPESGLAALGHHTRRGKSFVKYLPTGPRP
jgi:hypothetical protein